LVDLIKKQKEIKSFNEAYDFDNYKGILSKERKTKGKKPYEKYLILVDDCMGDPAMTGFQSELSNFCTRSRHLNMQFIWTGQTYTKLNDTVRAQGDMFMFLYMKPIKNKIFQELIDDDDHKKAKSIFEKCIKYGPQYSCLIIDTNGASKEHLNKWIYINQEKKEIEQFDI